MNPTECPLCKSEQGYYTRSLVWQTYFVEFDGTAIDSSQSGYKDFLTAYCIDCHKAIGKEDASGFRLYKKYMED